MDNDTITIPVEVTVDDMIDALATSTNTEKLVAFVKELDGRMATWDFTLALCEYFVEQKVIFDMETAADAHAVAHAADCACKEES